MLAATKNLIRISCFLASALTAGVKCTPNTAAFQAFNGFLSQEIMLFTRVSKCHQTRICLHCMSTRTGVIRNVYCCLVGCRVKLDPSDMRNVKLPVVDSSTMQSFPRCTNQTQVTNKISSFDCLIDNINKNKKRNSEIKYL